MSVRVSAWVWSSSSATGVDRLVALALADRADDAGVSWPSVGDVADRCRVSESTARRALRRLVDAGELERVDTPGQRSRWRLTMVAGDAARSVDEPVGEGTSGSQDDTPANLTPLSGERTTPVTSDRAPLSLVTAEPSGNRQEPSSSSGPLTLDDEDEDRAVDNQLDVGRARGIAEVLATKLAGRGMRVQTHRLSVEQLRQVVELVELHGDTRLVEAAVAAWRVDSPARFLQGLLGTWSVLAPPGQHLRLVERPRCDRHPDNVLGVAGCAACRSERLAGEAPR